ncbi:MAG: hypothetical protein U0230_21205 [Polyangiales bacterium]
MAHERRIVRKRRLGPSDVASARDFWTRGGSDISLEGALRADSRSISPYGLDLARREVSFVRTRPELDLAKAHPFFYEAQRENAETLITASFDEVRDTAAALGSAPFRFAFLYSPGRCGSTVAGKIAGRLPGVQSISEPDFFSQVTLARIPSDAALERELVRVTASTSRLLGHHRLAVAPSRPVLFVKHRGMSLYAAELIRDAVPRSRSLFLHRNANDVIDSYIGAFLRSPFVGLFRSIGLDRLAVRILRVLWPRLHPAVPRFMPLVIEPGTPDRDRHGVVEILALGFHSMMQEAARLDRSGALRFDSVLRYEDLTEAPERFVRDLASGLGVDLGSNPEPTIREALLATKGNSQAGSAVASDGRKSLSAGDVLRVERVLSELGGMDTQTVGLA